MAVTLVLLGGLLFMFWLQFRFDHADLKHAVEAVQVRFPRTHDCQGTIKSAWRGLVKVTCREGVWIVDVVRGVIYAEK